MVKKIYLDHSATTPVDSTVKSAMLCFFDKNYGNPSSMHLLGVEAKKAIEKSAEKAALFLGCHPDEIVFTSGATEANNTIIKGIVKEAQRKQKKVHIITTKIEHHCVLETAKYLEKEDGIKVTYLNIDDKGFISLKELEEAITKDTVLVSIMYANNEIGVIEPIKAISRLIKAKNKNIVFHTDAVQALSFLNCDVKKLGVDALSFSGHKFYGPKGIGGFYLKKGVKIVPLLHGGLQQNGMRAGTENVSGIVGIGKVFEIAQKQSSQVGEKIEDLRNYLADSILKNIPDCWINGQDIKSNKRLLYNLNMTFPGAEGSSLLELLSQKGIAVSIGSACSARELKPSHVLVALGLSSKDALCSVRFTLGKSNTKLEIDYTVKVLKESVKKMRKISGYKIEQIRDAESSLA